MIKKCLISEGANHNFCHGGFIPKEKRGVSEVTEISNSILKEKKKVFSMFEWRVMDGGTDTETLLLRPFIREGNIVKNTASSVKAHLTTHYQQIARNVDPSNISWRIVGIIILIIEKKF